MERPLETPWTAATAEWGGVPIVLKPVVTSVL